MNQSKIEGLLIGGAVADALGLPMEGMSAAKIETFGWTENLAHRFILRRGMWSDDTEQTIMLTQALLLSNGDLDRFRRSFAWELRWWILGLPAATGFATARAIVKLWLGFSPKNLAVFSAGNGSAMRTAPIAARFPDDPEKRRLFSDAHTRITHSDPKAMIATRAVTEVAALLLNNQSVPDLFPCLFSISDDKEWQAIVQKLHQSLRNNLSLIDYLESIGSRSKKGISGYVYDTVPAVLFLGIRHEWGYKKVVAEIIAKGGDTDTTAAIAGALCGAFGGVESIPGHWVSGVNEWPTSLSQMESLARAICRSEPLRIRARWSPALLLRNLLFLCVVLIHGFGRLLIGKRRIAFP